MEDQASESLAVHSGSEDASSVNYSKDFWSSRSELNLMHYMLKTRPFLATAASKLTINLPDKGIVIDASGGATAAAIGHGNKCGLYNRRRGIPRASNGFSKVYLVGSGSEANDAVIKLASQYFYEKGQLQRTKFISRRQAYHESTISSLSLSTAASRVKQCKGILMPNTSHVGPCYPYQYRHEHETTNDYVSRLDQELEDEFQRLGPENKLSAGQLLADTRQSRTASRLFILAEVMCGMSRTGSIFAWQDEGVVPDIFTIGKGLGAGYIPIPGMLANSRVIEAIESGSGWFNQACTFQAHPVACASALAVQNIVKRDNLVANSKKMGKVLEQLLTSSLAGKKYVRNIRGRGLFYAVEFAKDKETRETGTVDEKRGDHILLAPAFIMTPQDLEGIVKVIMAAYDITEQEVAAEMAL
ncbi:MAG: hypothetical protein M1834_003291 [Cirrosporium novae-zelandiae]|nr:MAG: hypothetical protein M1834_003291 [Cirrosporium novae-zelandiae]